MAGSNTQAVMQALADHINELGAVAADAHMDFCKALAAAAARVYPEFGMTFKDWAHKYLRRPNGRRWSWETLRTYVRYGQDPQKLEKKREYFKQYHAVEAVARRRGSERRGPIDVEVNKLMTAWDEASDQARHQFLSLINAKLILPRRGPR